MVSAVVVNGPCKVSIDSGGANALEELGYGRDGIHITETVFTSDVPGDQNGGDEGPPIDVQYFGEIHRIRMELTKWDVLIADKLLPKLYGGTAGATGTAGTLLAAESKGWRLLLQTTTRPRNYLEAYLREQPVEINKGTKFSTLTLEWECHSVAGTLFNTTVI